MGPSPVILIVDDNPDHRFLARQTLSREADFQVDTAASGEEAISKIQAGSFNLILLDYNMPGMNGSETLSRILEINPDLPVIMLTGGGSESVAVELIEAGAYDYIVKSDDYLSTLPGAVSKALQRRQLADKTRELELECVKLAKLSAVVETAIAVNHEINNPLFAIKANTQMLQKRFASDDPRVRRQIDGILESCERISVVTRKLAGLVEPTSKIYANGSRMLDLDGTSSAPPTSRKPLDSLEPEKPQAEDATDYLPILWQINHTLTSSLDLDHILHELVMVMSRLLQGTMCSIGLLENGDTLRIKVRCIPGNDGEMQVVQNPDICYSLAKHPIAGQVLDSGEPLIFETLDDPRLSEDETRIIRSFGAVSLIMAPIRHQNQPLGVLLLGRPDRVISQRESMLCQLISGLVSIAIYNALQHRDLQKKTEQLQTLVAGVSTVISKVRLQERLDDLVHLVARVMDARIVTIRLLEGDGLVLEAEIGLGNHFPRKRRIHSTLGLGSLVLESEGPVIIEDLKSDPRPAVQYFVRESRGAVNSYMGIRLTARNQIIGIMGFFTEKARSYSQDDIDVFAALADQAAMAIDNARLYQESMQKAREIADQADQTRIKHEIVQAVLASNRIGDICDKLVKNVPRLIRCEMVALNLIDYKQEVHRVVAYWSCKPTSIKVGTEIPFKDTILSDMLIIPKPVLIRDMKQETSLRRFSLELVEQGMRSGLVLPVCFGGRVLGTFCLGTTRVNGIHQEQIRLAQELADQVAIAIQNALLLETISVSKAEWEATFDAITDPVWVQTPECEILKANMAASESVGVNLEELIGKKCLQSFHGNPLMCEKCPVRQVLESGKPVSVEYQGLFDSTFLASVYPVIGDDSHLLATVSYIKDITEQKQIHRQLLHSTKLAAVGELAAGIAHNFNNLITGVRGSVELLQMQADRENLPPKIATRLQSIKERLDQGDTIVGRLLSFARGSSDELSELSIEKIVRESLAVCETHSDRKGIELRVDIPSDLPMVVGIDSHLQQVLVNLIINAFQATERGGIIEVKACAVSRKGFVEIYVSDTGCGIQKEDLDRIFEPFYSKRRGNTIGTGLGLPVSRTMVEAMGGTLSVESTPGQGSIFVITLRQVKAGKQSSARRKTA